MTGKTKSTKPQAALSGFDPFNELNKALGVFAMPGVDLSALIGSRRQDIDALIAANGAAYQAMQAVSRKQTEMLTQTVQAIQEAAQAAAGGAGFNDPVKCAELAGDVCQKALGDMRELAEMIRQAQLDVMNRVSQRANEAKREVEQMMKTC
jgi:phasin family protein